MFPFSPFALEWIAADHAVVWTEFQTREAFSAKHRATSQHLEFDPAEIGNFQVEHAVFGTAIVLNII